MGVMVDTVERAATGGDERILIHGVSWEQYETLLGILDEHPGVRSYYLEGTLEIMTTGPGHERKKSMIGRLFEHYAFVLGIDLRAYGSTTFRKEALERGAEPDECYVLGSVLPERPEAPDIAIEVVVTHGGLDKLAIYRGLGAREVWFYKKGQLSIHRLEPDGYRLVERSAYLPDLDPALVARYAPREDQLQALREFDRDIRQQG